MINPHQDGVGDLIQHVLRDGESATKFLRENLIIRATMKGKPRKHTRIVEIILTIGRPNYRERQWIKKYKPPGGHFPVPGIHVWGG